nr:hypothetical protein [Kibdelosporangium sp. MJ126-NF4]
MHQIDFDPAVLDLIEPTPEQLRIATDITRLAARVPNLESRIHEQKMTLDDWRALSDACGALGEQAEEQARITEAAAAPTVGRLPLLSEIAAAQRVDCLDEDLHWVFIPGRKTPDNPINPVERPALCGEPAVPTEDYDAFQRVCGLCRARLRVIHQRISEELGDV